MKDKIQHNYVRLELEICIGYSCDCMHEHTMQLLALANSMYSLIQNLFFIQYIYLEYSIKTVEY